jgi:hypothetical protein
VARLHSPSSRATTWQVRLGGEWDTVVVLPLVQMVGYPLLAPEAVDDPLHRAAAEEHHPLLDHTLRVEWNGYPDHSAAARDPRPGLAGGGSRQLRSGGPRPIDLCPTREGPSHTGTALLAISRLCSVSYSLVLQRRVAYPARPARPLARRIMLPGSGTNSSSTTGCSSSTTAARTSPAKLAG